MLPMMLDNSLDSPCLETLHRPSPVAQLPTEIIAEIFQIAIHPKPGSFLTPDDTGTDRNHFKALRSVCRHWREAAFCTQSLWTIVWIDFLGFEASQVNQIITNVRSYFTHAGPVLPLTLGFQWRDGDDYPWPHTVVNPPGTSPSQFSAWNSWLEFLFEYRHRWEEISFFTTSPLFLSFEMKLRKERELADISAVGWKIQFIQVSLDDLPISSTSSPPGNAANVYQDSFPELETVSLNHRADALFTDRTTQLLAPHSNVTKIRIDIYFDYNTYFPLLSGFRRLRRLILACPTLCVIPLDEGPEIELPELKLLILSCPPSFSVLSRLRTPGLTTLQILTYWPPSPCHHSLITELQTQLSQSFHHLVGYARRCSATLRSLRLYTWFVEDDNLLRNLLEGLGSLETMCIDSWFRSLPPTPQDAGGASGVAGNSEIADAVTKLHLQNGSDSLYLPKLRRLCLHHHDDEDTPEPVDELAQPPTALTSTSGETKSPVAKDQEDTDDTEADQDDKPFQRGEYSWPSLASFVRASTLNLDNQDTRKKFTFCVSGLARRAGGEEARSAIASLENAGVEVTRESMCRVYW